MPAAHDTFLCRAEGLGTCDRDFDLAVHHKQVEVRMPLMGIMFHPIDRPKLERWAKTFEYHYVIDTSAMGNGYSVANMQIGPGERVYEIKRRMAEYGIRVFERPGVVMKVASSEPVDRGMEFGGMERLRAAIGLVEKKRKKRKGETDYYW